MATTVSTHPKEMWASRFGLVLAMAGNAVGLGNFLRFPVQAVQNGGGAFIIPYIVCFIVIGLPLTLMEWGMGKYGGCNGFNSPPFILKSINSKPLWKYVGAFGLFSNIVIAAYYCYIESWTMSYVIHSICGSFRGLSESGVSAFFDDYLNLSTTTSGIPCEALVLYILCLVLNVWLLSRGLQKGIEKVAKICVPLLIIFGLFLAIKAVTIKPGQDGAVYSGVVGLNFLWTPDFTSLTDPKVWLAAAGQIFFTLSLGMGCITCYSSYLQKKDDIVVNSFSTCFINEFCEIIIGSAVIIPIAVGYFGVDKVIELAHLGGFGLGFRTLPFLFGQWGSIMSAIAGCAFFGLLFFAGITSSLAMGSPIVAFFKDGFSFGRVKSSVIFGLTILAFGLPTVLFFQKGVFDDYDFWGGTFSLFVFALFETILFSWVLGLNKGWKIIHEGADMKLSPIFRFLMKYVTPTMLIIIFLSYLIKPVDEDWSRISFHGWEVDNSSFIGAITHKGIGPNNKWFSNEYYFEQDCVVLDVSTDDLKGYYINVMLSDSSLKQIPMKKYDLPQVNNYCTVNSGDVAYLGNVVNDVFYLDISRLSLLLLLFAISGLIFKANSNITKRNKIS